MKLVPLLLALALLGGAALLFTAVRATAADPLPTPPPAGDGLVGKSVSVLSRMPEGQLQQDQGRLVELGPDWVVIEGTGRAPLALNARFVYSVRADTPALERPLPPQ